jgi:hypothetical protein
MFHFPGDYNYQGPSTLLIEELTLSAFIIVNIIFDGEVNVELKILWRNESLENRDFADVMASKRAHTVTVIIKSQMIIIGTFRESSRSLVDNVERISLNVIRVTSFKVNRFARLQGGRKYYATSNSPQVIPESNWIRIKAYLNNEYCMNDWILESKEITYCLLNSGYYFKSGCLRLVHQEPRITRSNYERTYKFSFIEFIRPIQPSQLLATANSTSASQNQKVSFPLKDYFFLNEVRDAELLSGAACDFLSVLSGQELSPIFFEYEIHINGKSIKGQTIPVSSKRKLEQHGKLFSYPNHNLNLLRDFSFFLENCPLHEKLSRGISSLRMAISTDIVNLQLLSSCSALEYFFSFWLFEMHGFGKLLKSIDNKRAKKLNRIRDKGQTPKLSEYLKPFLLHLTLSDLEYIDLESSQPFLNVRNELLHGRFISDHDIEIFEARAIAQSLATEVLISIMQILNPLCRDEFYKNVKARKPLLGFTSAPDGWDAVRSAMYCAYDESCENIYWDN